MEQLQSTHRRIAVVTGASRSNGIGAAICRALAAKGMDIFFTYWTRYDREMPWGVRDDEPTALQRGIERDFGVRCERMELDLAAPEAADALLDETARRLGEPSVLINNATYSVDVGYDALTADVLDAHYRINVRAPMLLSAAFCRRFPFARGGRIVNVTSGQSLGPMPGNIAYASTKGAIEPFTVTLSAEVAAKGITVNAVNPGPTDTGWMDEATKAAVLAKSPSGRIGTPDDAARLIAFLASEEAEWVTGQIIHSEGGFLRT